jgi:hypothetical protein
LKQPLDPHVATIVLILRATQGEHRGRTRISLGYLAHLAGIHQDAIGYYLNLRHVRDAMARYSWHRTDSKALGLPPVERGLPLSFLARQRD